MANRVIKISLSAYFGFHLCLEYLIRLILLVVIVPRKHYDVNIKIIQNFTTMNFGILYKSNQSPPLSRTLNGVFSSKERRTFINIPALAVDHQFINMFTIQRTKVGNTERSFPKALVQRCQVESNKKFSVSNPSKSEQLVTFEMFSSNKFLLICKILALY